MSIKLYETENRVRAELHARHERGECSEIRDMDAISLADDDGFYVRITVQLVDGSEFHIDTDEPIRITRRH